MKNKKRTVYIIFSILIFCSIFYLSSREASESKGQSNTVIVFLKLMTAEEIIENPEKARMVSFFVRKSAHFSIYALLGIFVYLSTNEYKQIKRTLRVALLITLFLAGLDEIHQSFVPGRSMEIRDVLIDTLGALMGMVTMLKMKQLYRVHLKDHDKNMYIK